MLRGEHSIVVYESGLAQPDRLTRGKHAHYLSYADRLIAAWRAGIGRTRNELHRTAEQIFARENDCGPRRVSAFCKLLDEAGEFADDPRGTAAKLRLQVFALAARYHPLVTAADQIFERTADEVKQLIATELKRPWPEIESQLYGDVIAFQRLTAFSDELTAELLLSRYNVGQLQACLYKAASITIRARSDFKTVLRYAKLARLLHVITCIGPNEYRIDLTGPASLLSETRRYGVNFARFVPALLACKDWRLHAQLRTPWNTSARLVLSSEDGYSSHLPPPETFDSSVEESFAGKFGTQREGWRLSREGVILHTGQTTFIPDFTFRHERGREVHLEVVGFWTPEYLAAKRETIRRFREHNIILAVSRPLMKKDVPIPENVIVYKTVLKPEAVLEVLRWRALDSVEGPTCAETIPVS